MSTRYNRRITYMGSSSGEYLIYVDGKLRCSSDNYKELQEDLKDIEEELEQEEKRKESTN